MKPRTAFLDHIKPVNRKGRPRKEGERYGCGKLKVPEVDGPTPETLAKAKQPREVNQPCTLARLMVVDGHLTKSQGEAAHKLMQLLQRYQGLIGSPVIKQGVLASMQPSPPSRTIDDSRREMVELGFKAACRVLLMRGGADPFRVVMRAVEGDGQGVVRSQWPDLRLGLDVLVELWGM